VPDRDFGSLLLEYGTEVSRTGPDRTVRVEEDDDAIIITAPQIKLEFRPGQSGLFARAWCDSEGQFADGSLITRADAPPRIGIVDDAGNEYDTLGPVEAVEVEEAGPLRAVVRLDGHHAGPAGEYFTYQTRVTVYAGQPWVRVSYRWGNDRPFPEFSYFRGIRMCLPLSLGQDASVTIGGEQPLTGSLDEDVRLAQMYDDRYTASGPGGATEGGRAPGWMEAHDAARSVTLMASDFWQLYPKALSTRDHGLVYEICPEFPKDQYADCSELDLVKLYYYLQNGRYKTRQGMTKVHEMVLAFGVRGGGDGAVSPGLLSGMVHEPVLLAARPGWYAHSGAFGEFIPKRSALTARYDEACDRVFDAYVGEREEDQEYGMLNFGDTWGERAVNWYNGEYDHHHVAAQMFLRSAEPRWARLMETAARHSIDVDLCHYHQGAAYAGGVWFHSMGHTGGYFAAAYKGQGYAHGSQNANHTWTEGTCEYYALTGDPTAMDAALMVADHYCGAYLNSFDFGTARDAGWPIVFSVATYRGTGDPFYLNAARLVVARVLERRTPRGGWGRQLKPGHCNCTPRCRGACTFMVAVLGWALREFDSEDPSDAVKQAIVGGANMATCLMWTASEGSFRYSSCLRSPTGSGFAMWIAPLLLAAYGECGSQRLLEIARQGLAQAWDSDPGSMAWLRWTPYVVWATSHLASVEEGAGEPGAK